MPNNQSIVQSEPASLASTSTSTNARVEQRSFVKPPCDVYENADEFLLVVDVPGVTKEGLSIQMEQGEVTIEARRQEPAVQGKLLSTEYVPSDYQRRFALPADVEQEQVQAELRDGVLRIRLPKSESAKPRLIPIH